MTASGVKPICTCRNIFKSTYILEDFSPYNGNSLYMGLPNCNGENFQIFLNEFSNKKPEEFKVVILDHGAFHKGKALIILENSALLFLSPYSAELNPAVLVWLNLKRKTTNIIYKTMEEIKEKIDEMIKKFDQRRIH